jgi:hypothetical protein
VNKRDLEIIAEKTVELVNQMLDEALESEKKTYSEKKVKAALEALEHFEGSALLQHEAPNLQRIIDNAGFGKKTG